MIAPSEHPKYIRSEGVVSTSNILFINRRDDMLASKGMTILRFHYGRSGL